MIEKYFNSSYAGQEVQYLPTNAYIDKTVCGVGMTSVAIECKRNTLILVPTKLLVSNKVCQYPNERCSYHLQGVTGDIDDYTIHSYIQWCNENQPVKLICTYDSLHRALKFAQRDDVQIVVDESDKIVSMAPIKASKDSVDVMNYMLQELESLKDSVTFLSSTPVPLEYYKGTKGEWLTTLNHIKCHWKSTITSAPFMCKRKQPIEALKNEVIAQIEAHGFATIGDRTFKKAIIFVNSVMDICKIIQDCGIEDVSGIICSDTNHQTIKRLNDYGYQKLTNIQYNNLPRYTFVTSSGFQGIDLYDDESMNVIITKGSHKVGSATMLDLQLDVKQAISRNRSRNNPNADRFVFFYNQGAFDKSFNDVENEINNQHQEIENQVAQFNTITVNDKYLSTDFTRYVFRGNGGKFYINELVFSHDRYIALEVIKMYQNGFTLMSNVATTFSGPIVISKPRESKATSYQPLYQKYSQQISGQQVSWLPEELACENYRLINRCYQDFGKLFENSSYTKSMVEASEKCKVADVDGMVKSRIHPGKHSCKELKETLQSIYNELGYNKTAKATDIKFYYPNSSDSQSGKDGKYIIVK